jgi:folylpolyglutamate synthase/dihydropteroate synthase
MLIESSILGKNFLALVHEEVGNFTSPHIVRSSHEHFVGIEALPNLHFVENLADLASQFEEVFHKKNLPQEEIDRQLSYFYDLKPLTYSQKLGKLVEEILL